MPSPPPPNPPDNQPLPDYEFEPDKSLAYRARALLRRKRLWLIVLVLVGTPLTLWKGPDVYRDLKGRRALGFIAKGEALLAEGKSVDGASFIRRGVNMAPYDRRIREKLILLRARDNDPAAQAILIKKSREGLADPAEILTAATGLAAEGQLDEASEFLNQLPATLPTDLDILRAVLTIQLAAENDLTEALALARQASSDHPTATGNPFRAVLVSMALRQQPPDLEIADELLASLISDPGPSGAAALRIAARQLAISPGSLDLDPDDVARQLATHPQRTPSDTILRFQLNLVTHPTSQPEALSAFVSDLIADGATLPERTHFALWLLNLKVQEPVLELIDEASASRSFDGLNVRLEALQKLQRWDDANRLIDATSSTVLPDLRRHYMLAFIARQQGDSETERTELARATDAIEQADTNTHLFTAKLAQSNGHSNLAFAIYQHLSQAPETELTGLFGMVESGPSNTPVHTALPVFERLLQIDPDSSLARSGVTYLSLLTGTNLEDNRVQARKWLAENPGSPLGTATLALAELRNGDAAAALAVIAAIDAPSQSRIDWSTQSDNFKAVLVAVLEVNERHIEADHVKKTVNPLALRWEEVELIRSRIDQRTAEANSSESVDSPTDAD